MHRSNSEPGRGTARRRGQRLHSGCGLTRQNLPTPRRACRTAADGLDLRDSLRVARRLLFLCAGKGELH